MWYGLFLLTIHMYIHYCTRFNNLAMHPFHSNSSGTIPLDHFHLCQIIHDSQCEDKILYSFELVSRKEESGIYKTFFSQVKECSPVFYALTWHNNEKSEDFVSLENLQQFPKNTLFHLAARGIKRDAVVRILDRVLELEIKHLFIIRGDCSADGGDFYYAVDLIKFITERYDNKFCIGVAGYPSTHPDSMSKATDLYYLKEKVDAGSSFIITQIIFESTIFIDFVRDCREYGIIVPIIPFVMPILSYKSFITMTKNCNLSVPKYLSNKLETMKNDTNAVQQYGVSLTVKIINDIIYNRCASIIHLCTLNNAPSAIELCRKIEELVEKKNKQ